MLIKPVTEKQTTAALKIIGNDKASGFDGFGVYFFKQAWQIIKEDVVEAIQDFFTNNRMYKDVNCSTVTLIPKHNGSKEIKDYRPNAFCSTLYKIFEKMLANRLSKVLGAIIGDNQVAFVKGQKNHNHILLTYELIKGYEKKRISARYLLQMDIQKAYDTINWNVFEKILSEVGCPQQLMTGS